VAARRRRGAVGRAASGRRAAVRFKFRFDLNDRYSASTAQMHRKSCTDGYFGSVIRLAQAAVLFRRLSRFAEDKLNCKI